MGTLVPSYFGLIFKFKPEQELAVIGLDMTTSSKFGLGFQNLSQKSGINLETKLQYLTHM